MSSHTATLCRFVAETSLADVPPDVVDHAKRMLLDTVGVTVLAADTDTASIARRTSESVIDDGARKRARVVGTTDAGSLADVAFVTGVMAHALDFDDVHPMMGGHPSAPVLGAVLPLGEQMDASGDDVLRAFVLGVETELALAEILNPGHYERGWHPTAVLGHVGAAVGAGALLGLDAEALRRTVGIAASQAGGMKGNFGTMTKPYHVGNAARSGVEAARLAANGFTANASMLEREFGGFAVLFQGDPPAEFGDVLETLGERWRLADPPTGFKPYPCCGSTHAAIDAAIELSDDPALRLDDVETITVTEHPRRIPHTDDPTPTTGLEGKFSVQYCTAVALETGDIWLEDFDDDVVTSDDHGRLRDRVEVVADPDATAGQYGAVVEVTFTDGTAIETTVDHPLGSYGNPFDPSELDEKYRRCAGSVLTDDAVESSLADLRALEEVDDVAQLVDVLCTVRA